MRRAKDSIKSKGLPIENLQWIYPCSGGRPAAELKSRSEQSASRARKCKVRKLIPHASFKARHLGATHMPSASPLPPLRFQSWSHDEILADFLTHCVPAGATQEVPLSWLRALMPMEKEIDALPLAMSALAVGWAGHADGEPQLIDKGLQLYSAAVRQLRADIPVARTAPLQVLATTALFTLYELCEFGSESSRGWLCHMSGLASTLRLLGPEMVAAEPYLQIYSFIRTIYVRRSAWNIFSHPTSPCPAVLCGRNSPNTASTDDTGHQTAAQSLCRGSNVADDPVRALYQEPLPQVLRPLAAGYRIAGGRRLPP